MGICNRLPKRLKTFRKRFVQSSVDFDTSLYKHAAKIIIIYFLGFSRVLQQLPERSSDPPKSTIAAEVLNFHAIKKIKIKTNQ